MSWALGWRKRRRGCGGKIEQQVTGNRQQVTGNNEGLHNLPEVRKGFFGRTSELTLLQEHLTNPSYRLVTLVGGGGSGKTALAIEVGRRLLSSFPDGVWFVPLVGATDTMQIVGGIAQALDFSFTGQAQPLDQLINFLREAELLLVLDNLEHLLDEVDVLAELLQRTRQLAMLCTSREVLNFEEEVIVVLGGLMEEGARGKDLGEANSQQLTVSSERVTGPAVRLFEERGKRADARFGVTDENVEQVLRIIKLVEGNPLGIELAAAWVRTRSLGQIVTGVEASADFLATRRRDVDKRHRSMRAVFESSWQMLEPEEQTIFARLSVFQGGFSAEAAQQVTGASLFDLDGLIEKSLIERRAERYSVHELLRQFSAERLVMAADALDKHCHYFLSYFEGQHDLLHGVKPLLGIEAIQSDEANIWHAWKHAIAQRQWDLLENCLVISVDYLHVRGRIMEAVERISSVIEPLTSSNTPLLAMALIQRARSSFKIGQLQQALIDAEAGKAMTNSNEHHALAVIEIANVCHQRGETRRAQEILQQMLPHVGTERLAALINLRLGYIANYHAEFERAFDFYTGALSTAQHMQDGPLEAAVKLHLGHLAYNQHDIERARYLYRQAGKFYNENQLIEGQVTIQMALGHIAYRLDNFSEARALLTPVLNRLRLASSRVDTARILNLLGMSAVYLGEFLEGAELLEQSAEMLLQAGQKPNELTVRLNAAHAYVQLQDENRSRMNLRRAQQIGNALSDTAWRVRHAILEGDIYYFSEDWNRAAKVYRQAYQDGVAIANPVLIIEALTGMIDTAYQIGLEETVSAEADTLLEHLRQQGVINQLYNPTRSEWIIYQHFARLHDNRARTVHQQAVERINRQLATLKDRTERDTYRRNVQYVNALLEDSLRWRA